MKNAWNVTCAALTIGVLLSNAFAAAVKAGRAQPVLKVDGRNSFAVRNVRVFDGERTLTNQTVVVRDGLVVAIGARTRAAAGIPVIDGRGKTLLPGLIDAHVHAWGEAQADALRFGVTSELDMLGDSQRLPALRRQRESLARTGQADLWSAGSAVTAPGGHGTQFGMEVPTLAAGGNTTEFVKARVAEGSDYLKLIVEHMSEFGAKKPWPTLTASQVAATVAAAHAARRLAVVHATRQEDARQAIESGADGLVHTFIDMPADPAFVQLARKRGVFVVSTLSVWASNSGRGEEERIVAEGRMRPFLSATQIADLKTEFPAAARRPAGLQNALSTVRSLHAAGVTILAGTDAPNPGTAHGASIHGELELLVRAGLKPEQALAAATSVPAQHFSLSDRGRIAVGKRADLVLVDGDPTRDITATRAIAMVWKNGYAVERALPKVAAPAEAVHGQATISYHRRGTRLVPCCVGAGTFLRKIFHERPFRMYPSHWKSFGEGGWSLTIPRRRAPVPTTYHDTAGGETES